MKQCHLFVFSITLIIVACNPAKNTDKLIESASVNNNIIYASKFEINDGVLVVTEPWPGATTPKYYDLNEPPRSVVVTSTSHLPFLEMLSLENRLVGFPNTAYISSEKINALVDSGKIVDIGTEGKINLAL